MSGTTPEFDDTDLEVIRIHIEEGFASFAADVRLEIAIGYLKGCLEDLNYCRAWIKLHSEIHHSPHPKR